MMLLLCTYSHAYCFTEKISNETCTNSYECGGKLLCENGECQCPIDLFWNGNKCIVGEYLSLLPDNVKKMDIFI